MKIAVSKAKLGESEELSALRRLDDQPRRLEASANGPSVEALIARGRMLARIWWPQCLRLGAAGILEVLIG